MNIIKTDKTIYKWLFYLHESVYLYIFFQLIEKYGIVVKSMDFGIRKTWIWKLPLKLIFCVISVINQSKSLQEGKG